MTDIIEIIEYIDARLDGEVSDVYQSQPLAQDWARVSKAVEEAGEAIDALIGLTGQNPRKGRAICNPTLYKGRWRDLGPVAKQGPVSQAEDPVTCPNCGPTDIEQHPRLASIIRCANCSEHLGANVLRTFRVHKTRGTCKIVNVEAHQIEFHQSGMLLFWRNTGTYRTLVMAYSAWAWKTVSEETTR